MILAEGVSTLYLHQESAEGQGHVVARGIAVKTMSTGATFGGGVSKETVLMSERKSRVRLLSFELLVDQSDSSSEKRTPEPEFIRIG